MSTLVIAAIQNDIVWEDMPANLKRYSSIIERISHKVDLIILPEMFQTGFTMEPAKLAEDMEGETINWMKAQAKSNDCCISGSIIINERGIFYNRFLFVEPNGEIQYYNKRHLFSYGGENKHFTGGKDSKIILLKDWKILPRICYDLRFPVWNRDAKNADLLIFTANWPSTRIIHWDTLLQARSIENQIFSIGVNRVGTDGNELQYTGHTSAYRFDGNCIDKLGDSESIMMVTLLKDEQDHYRNKFPFLGDADDFSIS